MGCRNELPFICQDVRDFLFLIVSFNEALNERNS